MEHFHHHFHLDPTPTPSTYNEAQGFEQSMFGNQHGGAIDDLTKFWIPFAAIYTFILCLGMTIIYFQRFTQAVRIRGFWLTCAAVFSLHIYLLMIFLSYPLRFWYGCTSEFWVMATIFPFGLGLFQISNARFIYYYQTQQDLLARPHRNKRAKAPCCFRDPLGFLKAQKSMNFMTKTLVFVFCTWLLTIIFCAFMYFGAFNFHESYGLFGEWSGDANCHRGPHGEWVPTAMGQLLMTWFWGPYMLWYARNIQDTHYWSLQTKINLLAGLPGTPLWLAFLYSNNPTIIAINRWFPHAGWFIPGIITIQMGAIIFPILDICKAGVYMMNLEDDRETNSPESTSDATNRRMNKGLYSMSAFETALMGNIEPLLAWAANRNFTAAEINFLVYVRNWKENWGGPGRRNRSLNPVQARTRFEDAAIIFLTFINPETSKVTINIDDHSYRDIAKYFSDVVARDLHGEGVSFFSAQQQVAPWENEHASQSQRTPSFDRGRLQYVGDDSEDSDDDLYEVPKGFSLSVFDDAYRIIKEDLFYSTWMHYVNDIETTSMATETTDHLCTEACKHETWTPSPLQTPAQAHVGTPRF
ncbi:putative integral membrane protein [Neofusicoccum parvum]|uniref:Integral membrane protein n=1 Tax=Neofusicoccum parvum TaxID=310453 RepID=A0ACB5RXC8_9PEZI|nr:putative integral membrane protein [Neofusicoccum parvum]